jgi:hypothetical protein
MVRIIYSAILSVDFVGQALIFLRDHFPPVLFPEVVMPRKISKRAGPSKNSPGKKLHRREKEFTLPSWPVRRGKVPAVRGHKLVLETALTKILGKALKFVAPGVPPKIIISKDKIDHRVRVLDCRQWHRHSARISPEIFEVFQRLIQTESR